METITFNYEKIKHLAKQKKIANKSIYEMLSMSKQNFDYLLKTGNLQCHNLAKICTLLECKPDAFFDTEAEDENISIAAEVKNEYKTK